MAKKTVFRRHSKMLPLSPHTREVLDRDNDGDSFTENERFNNATPVKASVLPEAPRRRGRPPKLEQEFGQQPLAPEDEQPPETPQTPSEPQESVPPSNPSAAAQTPSEELPGVSEPSLAEQVLAKVLAAGFTEQEMIVMLKKKRIITTEDAPHVKTLSQVKERSLLMCLDQWENAQMLLEQQRAGKL
jgi:hypothetical protein